MRRDASRANASIRPCARIRRRINVVALRASRARINEEAVRNERVLLLHYNRRIHHSGAGGTGSFGCFDS